MTSRSVQRLELLILELVWTESRNGFPVPTRLTSAIKIQLCASGFRVIASDGRFLASDVL